MNGCSAGCGYCGMCEDGSETRRCHHCEELFYPGPSVIDTSLGTFCSQQCADDDEADFAEYMKRRGFNQVLG